MYDASEYGNLSLAIDALNSYGVDVNERGPDGGETPLWIACSYRNHIEIVKILLKRKDLQVNLAADDGRTALYVASQYGHLEVVRLLLSKSEIDINKDADGWNGGSTALYMASQNGHLEVVRLLLSKSEIDINKKFKNTTPLAIAKQKGHTEIVKLLEMQQQQQQQPYQMVKVVCPANAAPGTTLRIDHNGRTYEIVVPEGITAGGTFEFPAAI